MPEAKDDGLSWGTNKKEPYLVALQLKQRDDSGYWIDSTLI